MKQNMQDLTEGPLGKKILIFSVPLMLSNLLQVLFNMADIAVIGQFAGSLSLGAVGSTATLVTMFTGFLIGLSGGINVLTALYYGAKDRESLSKTIHSAALVSLIMGVLLLVLGVGLSEWMLTMLKTREELLDKAVLYLRIYYLGMPALAIYNFGNAVYSAVGNTKKPLYYLGFSGVLNIILNLFFVIVCHMDVAGVALASIISQYVSAALILQALLHCKDIYALHPGKLRLDPELTKDILKLGMPSGLQNVIFQFANSFVQMGVNSFDATMVAGNSAATNADAMVYDVMAAFYTACGSFMGQNYGAGKPERIWLGIKASVLMMIIYAAFTFVLLMSGAKYFALIFVDPSETEILLDTELFLHISCMFFPVLGLLCVLRYTIQGVGFTNLAMFSGVAEMIARILVSLYAVPAFGFLAVCYGDPLAWIAADLFLVPAFIYVYKRLKKQVLTNASVTQAVA